MNRRTILITGATGLLGRQILQLLLDSGATKIIATTRNPKKLASFESSNVAVRYANFDLPETLDSAFSGADIVLLISTDDVEIEGRRVAQHQAAISAAIKANVTQLFYTSHPHATDTPALPAEDHCITEKLLSSGSMLWASLRNNSYSDLLIPVLQRAVARGKLYGATEGGAGAAYVTREDCAHAAVAALLSEPGVLQGPIEITGPRVVSYPKLAQIATELTGKQVDYHALEPETFKESMLRSGIPEKYANGLATIDIAMQQGKFAATDKFQTLCGRAAASVETFLFAHRGELLQAPKITGTPMDWLGHFNGS